MNRTIEIFNLGNLPTAPLDSFLEQPVRLIRNDELMTSEETLKLMQ